MGQRIVIELSTEEEAVSLAGALGPLFGDAAVESAHVILTADRPGERFVVDVLDALKAWVDAAAVDSVQVLLDGRAYTLGATRHREVRT